MTRLTTLLVEDDRELRLTLTQALTVEGYRVLPAASLADASALWHHAAIDDLPAVVLLDLGLPDGDGAQWLIDLRQRTQTPVIVLSARHLDQEKVRLLDLGADDYLVKPFGIEELLARMRVALRHRGRLVSAAVTRYAHADLEIDVTARSVKRGGLALHLTPTEFKLLARLVRNTGQVVTHRQLLADVWGSEFTSHTHYLRLYMGQLRAKLEQDSAQPVHLLTEPGVGYRLRDPH